MTFLQGSKCTYFAVSAANILAIICGTSVAWSSPVIALLEDDDLSKIPLGRKITKEEASWIGSLASLGGIFGPFIFGYLMQKIGRKLTVALLGVPFFIAYLMAAFTQTVELYYVSRVLMGIGVGGQFCSLPIYIAEISENVNRGMLEGLMTSNGILGVLLSYCIGPYVSIMAFNLTLTGFCIIFFPIFWYVAPESPHYLIIVNKEEEALTSLCYLRQKSRIRVRNELEEIKSHLNQLKPGSFLDIFKTKGTLKAFFYCIALIAFQQFSGITVILYFTQTIFDATGSDIPPEICSIIVGSVQFIVCCISPPLLDKAGRRLMLLIPVSGAIVAEVLMGVYFYLQSNGDDVSNIGWLPVFSLVMYIASFGSGINSVPWAVMGEILPPNIKTKAALLVASFFSLVGFLLTRYFGSISDEIGMAGSFWLFAGFCVLFNLFVYFFMFETKGKSFAEIQAILNK